jgi:subtilisin family serine protease
MKNLKLLLLVAFLCLVSCKKLDVSPNPQAAPLMAKMATDKKDYVKGELLVKFKGQPEGRIKEKVLTKSMQRFNDAGFHVIYADTNALEGLRRNPNVEWASLNYIVKPNSDPLFTSGQLWGMNNIKADQAWASGNLGNQSVMVGVIDAGIYFNHPDLCGQIWNNPFDPKDGVDNDGNGYVDDVNGWDFLGGDNGLANLNDNHGTHVSGTIGGLKNGIGVIGVAPQVTIIGARFLDGFYGGSLSDAVKAIDYITDLKIRHSLNIVATNNSWGGGGYFQGIRDAIERAKQADILFIAAAGNNGANIDLYPSYPACYDNSNIISVASINNAESRSSFSNYGPQNVDIGAPGENINSSIMNFANWGFAIGSMSGTSMAAPHVTGAAVLYKAVHPAATHAEIKNAILSTARPISGLSGLVGTGGTLNVSSFAGSTPVQGNRPCPVADNVAPNAPTGLQAFDITTSGFKYSWTIPYDNMGVFRYKLYHKASSASYYQMSEIGNTGTPQWQVNNASPATAYQVYIVAIDYAGNHSQPSQILNVTTLGSVVTPPPPPSYSISSTLSTSGSTKTSHVLSWNITTNGTVSEVQVQVKFNNGLFGAVYIAPNATSGIFTRNVSEKGRYTYRIFAKISQGPYGFSNEVVINNKGK